MALRPFFGEFLVHPTPLHLDLNRCSHACKYCFAALSDRPFKVDWNDLQNNVLKGKRGNIGQSITKWLIHEGYPVLVSNTSDAFAKSNQDAFKAVKEFLDDQGVRICYQTKGGPEAFKILSEEKPTYVYISVTSDRDDITKLLEPNALSYRERLELIEVCIHAGHDVVVGLNPFVPEWWADMTQVVEDLHRVGAEKLYIQSIHMSNKAAPKAHKSFDPWKEYAKKKIKPDADYIRSLCDYLSTEFMVYAFQYGHYFPKGYWDKYESLFPAYPMVEDFLRQCEDQQAATGAPVAFDSLDVANWANIDTPFQAAEFKSYLSNWGQTIRHSNNGKDPKVRTYHQVLQHMFDIELLPSPFRHEDIAFLVDEEKGVILESENGGPYLVFDQHNNESYGYIDYKNVLKYEVANGPE